MKIVLVEDNHYQRDEIRKGVLERYPDATIEMVKTEFAFYNEMAGWSNPRPDVFLIDIMLRWTKPAPDMAPAPPAFSFLEAGFRCATRLQEELPGVPTVLYTVLDSHDIQGKYENLPPVVRYVRKSSDFRPLYEAIAELTQPAKKDRTSVSPEPST